jgi:YfiH family protein
MKVLQSSMLSACSGIAHGFYTRRGGVSEGIYASLNCGLGSQDDRRRVKENLARVRQHVDAENLVTLKQTHSTHVHVIEQAVCDERPQADALVTASSGIALGITGADCPTVLFADAESRVIGAVHAGWRGTFDGVLEATLQAMLELGAQCRNVVASVGPGIQQSSYEVGEEFRAVFVAHDDATALHFKVEGNALLFDLPGYVTRRLSQAGVRQVEKDTHDTFTDQDLFSYRRSRKSGDPDYGRQLGVIVLR